MSEYITVRGFVASDVREDKTHNQHPVANFRLGATDRRYNRETNTWEDGDTNWFSVACFRSLAKNVAFSVQKGERVVVAGRLKIRNWSLPDGRSGTTADIEADTVGHDLLLGVTKYKRNAVTGSETAAGGPGNTDPEREHPGLDRETGEILGAPDDGFAASAADGAYGNADGGSYGAGSGDAVGDDTYGAGHVDGPGHDADADSGSESPEKEETAA